MDNVPVAAAAVMAMTIGDALASIIGRRRGKHHYTFWGSTRSLEGSAVMAVSSLLVIGLTLSILPGSALSPNSVIFSGSTVLLLAISGAVVATIAESLSPKGTDNLFVPVFSAGAMFLLSGIII